MYLCHLGCQVFHPHITAALFYGHTGSCGWEQISTIAVVTLSIIVNYTRHAVVRNLHCWDFTTIIGWIKQPDVFNLSHRFSATQILEVHLRQKVRLKDGKARAALGKYEEGLYIVDKCREVWLLFRRADGRSKDGAELIKDEDSTSKNKQESESNGWVYIYIYCIWATAKIERNGK